MHKPGSIQIFNLFTGIMKCFTDVARISACFDDLKAVSIFNAKDFTITIDFWFRLSAVYVIFFFSKAHVRIFNTF